MIVTVCIGRGGSKGFPGKNKYRVLGKELMAWPLLAAKCCKEINRVYFSTDDGELAAIAKWYGAEVIDRPPELSTDAALGEDVFAHAYQSIKASAEDRIKLVVLLFANAPCVTSQMLTEMIRKLRESENMMGGRYDSICTVSEYEMFHPSRCRVIDGPLLRPFCPYVAAGSTSDRRSGGDSWFYDCCAAVVQPKNLEHLDRGMPPQRWLGTLVLPYKQQFPALDVDYKWQVPQVEEWLRRYAQYPACDLPGDEVHTVKWEEFCSDQNT